MGDLKVMACAIAWRLGFDAAFVMAATCLTRGPGPALAGYGGVDDPVLEMTLASVYPVVAYMDLYALETLHEFWLGRTLSRPRLGCVGGGG